MKKHMKDAAIIALWFMIFKLVIKLISFKFTTIFDEGIWLGIGVLLLSYTIVFIVAFFILFITRSNKSQSPTQVKH